MEPVLNRLQPFAMNRTSTEREITPHEAQTSFKTALNNALNKVNEAQNASSIATDKLAKGQISDLHEVMIIGEKASISLQATVEIRNKVIEAYQEVMRMQV